MRGIRDYWVKKLLFPKKVLIDEPGIITNCVMRKYGGVKSRQRMTVFFEDIISNLQSQSIKELGKTRASEIWYYGGKNAAERYFLLARAKVVPAVIFDSVLKYILGGFRSSGFSAAKNYYRVADKFIFTGDNNIICRNTGDSSYMRGFLSGTLSSLTGNEVDVVEKCVGCPNACCFSCTGSNIKHVFSKYSTPVVNYDMVNFPKGSVDKTKQVSFRNLMKFDKAVINNKDGLMYKNKSIILTESGCFELLIKDLIEAGGTRLLEKGVRDEAERLCKAILDSKTEKERIEELLFILCAFGWGVPSYKKSFSKLSFTFLNPPINRFGSDYLIYSLNGFVNYIFERKFNIGRVKRFNNPPVLTVDYIC